MRAAAMTAECPERPARIDALTEWRRRAGALLADGRAMRAKGGPLEPHLDAMAVERKALEEAVRGLDRAVIAAEAHESDLLAPAAPRWTVEAGGIAYDAPRYSALMDRVRTLDARPGVPEGARAGVDAHLARDGRWSASRQRVGEFLDQAGEVLRARDCPDERDVQEATPEWEGWLEGAREVRDRADAIERDIPEAETAAHLAALDAVSDGFAESERGIWSAIAENEPARIAEESARLSEEARIAEEDDHRARDREKVAAFLERTPEGADG